MASVPEQPFLVYPTQIRAYGLEAALLLQRYQQLLDLLVTDPTQPVAIVISREQWLTLVPFWDEEQLAMVTGELVSHQAIDVGFLEDGQVQVSAGWADISVPDVQPDVSQPGCAHAAVSEQPSLAVHSEVMEPNSHIAAEPQPETATVAAPPRVARRRISRETLMQQRGPAPTFGGSTGWRRAEEEEKPSDELHQVFNMREEHNQKLHSMSMGWKPSDTFFELLPRHGIPNEYAEECLDEFTLYWLDKDRKESNWDQKFLAWVKREWIRKQTREARQRNQDNSETTGAGHENPRRDTRENRKRVTAAIMDIKDTDW